MQVRTLRYVKRQQQGFLKTALNMIARFEALRNSRNSRPAQFFLNIDLSLSKDLVQGSLSASSFESFHIGGVLLQYRFSLCSKRRQRGERVANMRRKQGKAQLSYLSKIGRAHV